jgi:hypothetical protein
MTTIPDRVVFLGPDPLPALASGLPVICAEGCGLSRATGPRWESFPAPGTSSSATLLGLPTVQQHLRSQVDSIVVWKSSAEVERLAQELSVLIANSPALIARRIENKSHFSRSAPAAGLPVPPTRTGVAGAELLRAARALSGPLVFQLAHGFSGEQTYLAQTETELAELVHRFDGRSCRIAEQVVGTPVTVTGVVSPDRLVVGPGCLQLTGLASLTPHPLGSCGNDYGRPVPGADAVRAVALKTAEWLRDQGHLGVFGLDVVVGHDGTVWCIEINPRLVASVPLFSLSARDRRSPGILNHHLASFGIGKSPGTELACHWSQLILYQRAARLPDPELRTSRGTLGASGQFSPTLELDLAGPPPGEVGLVVQAQSRPGKELARVLFEGACCAPDGRLLPHLEALVIELRSQLEASSAVESVS